MTISLTKGQRISLTKESGGDLSRIAMGLGWDPVEKKGLARFFGSENIDLDASCLLFSGKEMVDSVWFRQLHSKDRSIVHTGDNLTGEGEGDDEVINVDLDRLPETIDSLVFTINSFRGQTFDEVENAFCRVVDRNTGRELVRYDLSEKGKHTGLIMCRVYRHNGEWKIHAIGEAGHGRTFHDMLPQIVEAW